MEFKSATGREEHDVRRLEWIVVRQADQTVVEAASIGCIFWSSEREMPLEGLSLNGGC